MRVHACQSALPHLRDEAVRFGVQTSSPDRKLVTEEGQSVRFWWGSAQPEVEGDDEVELSFLQKGDDLMSSAQ